MNPMQLLGGNWKLTLPVGTPGKPTEIKSPALATYLSEWFHPTADGDGVRFVAPTDGVTTKNSRNPRSELRELNADGTLAAWSSTEGVHSMEVELAVDALPIGSKPVVVIAQIHDANDDVTVFRFEGSTGDRSVGMLWITDGNNSHGCMVNMLRLGQRFRIGFFVQNGVIRYAFNGEPVDYEQRKAVTGCYFKTGSYCQSGGNVTKLRDGRADFASVIIYQLTVSHGGIVSSGDDIAKLRADVAALEAALQRLAADTGRRFAALKAAL